MSRRKVIAREALAYLKTAAYSVDLRARKRLRHGNHQQRHHRIGVVLVHGVGATPEQFVGLENAIRPHAGFIHGFSYRSTRPLHRVTEELAERISHDAERSAGVVVIGHSLGGLLLRIVLQSNDPPVGVLGFGSICAPLNGTTRCAFAPSRDLRSITPEAELFRELGGTTGRLAALGDRIVVVGSTRDHFIDPWKSAFLDGARSLTLEDAGHVSSLFDWRVHRAMVDLIDECAGLAESSTQ